MSLAVSIRRRPYVQIFLLHLDVVISILAIITICGTTTIDVSCQLPLLHQKTKTCDKTKKIEDDNNDGNYNYHQFKILWNELWQNFPREPKSI